MRANYLIFNFGGPSPPDEVMNTEGYNSFPLGSVEYVREQFARYLPEAWWNDEDPTIASVVDQTYLIDFYASPNDDGLVYNIGVFPYGTARAGLFMRRVCLPNGWWVFAAGSGDWIPPGDLGENT
ncbi:MAG: hypothetical protein U0641_00125 [Anaerolineae bacterium]